MKSNDLIVPVLLVQTAILIWLGLEVTTLQGRIAADAQIISGPESSSTQSTAPSNIHSNTLSARDVRNIIRAELGVFQEELSLAIVDDSSAPKSESAPIRPKRDLAELARLRADISGQIGLISSGAVPSRGEFVQLEQNIARLPKEERKAALSRMVRALEQGEIQVKF